MLPSYYFLSPLPFLFRIIYSILVGLLCGLLIYYLVSQFNKFVKLLILCVFNYIGNGIMLKFPAMYALGVVGGDAYLVRCLPALPHPQRGVGTGMALLGWL